MLGRLLCKARNLFPYRTLAMAPSCVDATFATVIDNFGGVIVNFRPQTPTGTCDGICLDQLEQFLADNILVWRQQGLRVVWFHLEKSQSYVIPTLVKNSFDFYYVQSGNLAMKRWISECTPDQVPPYAHTNIGVGALIVDADQHTLLVVKERSVERPHRSEEDEAAEQCPLPPPPGTKWKLPGGFVEPGENIHEAGVREVLEETGVRAEFCGIWALRHAHKRAFLCSDIYIIAVMRPLSLQIVKCDHEILDCKWMKVADFLSSSDVSEFNKEIVGSYVSQSEGDRGLRRLDLSRRSHPQLPYDLYHHKPV